MTRSVDRRTFVRTMTAAAGVALAGCGRAARKQESRAGPANPSQVASRPSLEGAAMTVYRDPGCGCCEHWATLARQAGYRVTLVDRTDMTAIKQKYGVPEQLAACHTAIVGDYVVEGHVPFADVKRLLEERPPNIKGIAVAGMPIGSPGMEVAGAANERLQVIAFDGSRQIPFQT